MQDEVKGVKEELKVLLSETKFEHAVHSYELSRCFPYNEVIIADPAKDVYLWLRGKIRKGNIVMQTNMSGGYTIAFTYRSRRRVLYGSAFSERAAWLRRRFVQLWPKIKPNNGKPFLFVVRQHHYYFLETG